MEILPWLLNTFSGVVAIISIFVAIRAYRAFQETHQLLVKIRLEKSASAISERTNHLRLSEREIDEILSKTGIRGSIPQMEMDRIFVDSLFPTGSTTQSVLTKEVLEFLKNSTSPELPSPSNTQYETAARPRLLAVK